MREFVLKSYFPVYKTGDLNNCWKDSKNNRDVYRLNEEILYKQLESLQEA